jgi:hypothetical protein
MALSWSGSSGISATGLYRRRRSSCTRIRVRLELELEVRDEHEIGSPNRSRRSDCFSIVSGINFAMNLQQSLAQPATMARTDHGVPAVPLPRRLLLVYAATATATAMAAVIRAVQSAGLVGGR